MSVESPARAAARAQAALTAVLPTPPFPATMTTRDVPKNWAGSNLCYPYLVASRRAQTTHPPPEVRNSDRAGRTELGPPDPAAPGPLARPVPAGRGPRADGLRPGRQHLGARRAVCHARFL